MTKDRWLKAQNAEYNSYKMSSKNFDTKKATAEMLAEEITPTAVNGKVLDIGGGYGHYSSLFENATERFVVDPLYDKIGIKINGIQGYGIKGETMPFNNNSFDFVLLRNVVDHMLYPEKLLQEACRVMKPNGTLYFMVNTYVNPVQPLFPLMDALDKPHPIHLTSTNARKMLIAAGFTIRNEKITPSAHFEWRIKRMLAILIKNEYYAHAIK
jgi:SAM-dependent methyltransferase